MSKDRSNYLPFRGLSAWFSSSVRPAISKKWDQCGGNFATEDDADYLFSDNSYSADTIRVYDTQPGVVVFRSTWIHQVLSERCTVYDVPLGRHLALPHFLVQVCMTGDPFKTPEASTLMELHKRGGSCSSPTAPAHMGNMTNLSQLLARREGRKSGRGRGRGSHVNGESGRLRNSREFYPSKTSDSVGKRETESGTNCCDEKTKCGAVCSTKASGVETQSEGVSSVAWNRLLHRMKTASLKGLQHIDDMETASYDLMDFDPCLPHFTMQRK